MKKILLSLSLLLTSSIAIFGQTDFNATDCAGAPHQLFSELDGGKVIVLVWVMPCSSCIPGAKAAYNASASFASSNPGRVFYYLIDDTGGSCSTLTSWATTNVITPSSVFANTGNVINMSNYGATTGMPKVVVLGGNAHTIFYNQVNTGFTQAAITTAITNALAAPNSIGINESSNIDFELNLFPNPVTNTAKIAFNTDQISDVSFTVYNMLGETVKTVTVEKQTAGKHEISINFESLSDGVYFMQIKVGNNTEIRKFSIVH